MNPESHWKVILDPIVLLVTGPMEPFEGAVGIAQESVHTSTLK